LTTFYLEQHAIRSYFLVVTVKTQAANAVPPSKWNK